MSRRPALVLAALAAATALVLTGCSSQGAEDADGADAAAGNDYGLITDGVLTVATEGTYRPFSYHEGGSGPLVGYDVEVVQAVAEKLDLTVEFKETQWDAIFAGLDADRFDVIANQVSVNPEREEKYLFSTPYSISPGVIVVPEDNTDITSFEDLDGKTTAQSLTSNWRELAEQNGAKVEGVEGWAQAVALLRQGRVDATINDKLTFLDYETTDGPTGLKIAAETDEAGRSAFAFTKDKQDLVEAFDDALAELQEDGTLAKLGEKYFGADVSVE